MAWQPKLVALDIDGTLVDESNEVTPRVKDAIAAVVAAGVPVILATGRAWASAVTIVEQLPLAHAEHVCSNGAVTVRYPPFEVVDVLTFDPRPVVDRIRTELPDALVAVEVVGQGYQVSSHFPEGELHGAIEVVPLEDMISRHVTRVVIRDPAASEHDFIALAHRLGLEGVSYSVGYTAWLDIAPHGVDKAHGLARVCARAGVAAADVLALGDGRNDIEMLAWAGRGVAMGGSPPELLAVADAVTGSLADHGLVAELGRWFPAPDRVAR
ncbi:HAD family hydrolase [Propioniciclava sp.]|uniref:HAD family hydrolase n=1 Tax=Propioniciclava sp. TaxID=2038686 RepID=UPI00262DE12C|nr:HAD family hydrolase [Propioniciclava sp.]